MFVVTTRLTFLKPEERGAVTELKFRHVGKGEPALNQRLNMTALEASVFNTMLKEGKTESLDKVAGRETTYRILPD